MLTRWFSVEMMGIPISDSETDIVKGLTVNVWLIATETANGI